MQVPAMGSRRAGMAATLAATLMACGSRQPPTRALPRADVLQRGVGDRHEAAEAPKTAGGGCELAHVYFEFDSSELDQRAKDVLAQDYDCARKRGLTSLRVTGMTDPQGVEEYNLALGDRRAKAAARYLSALGAKPPETTSVGEEMASGSDRESWSRDRRAELEAR